MKIFFPWAAQTAATRLVVPSRAAPVSFAQAGTQIDWSNPVVRGMRSSIRPYGETFVDAVSGMAMQANTAGITKVSRKGKWFDHNGGAKVTFPASRFPVGGAAFTVEYLWITTAGVGGYSRLLDIGYGGGGGNGGWDIEANSGSGMNFVFWNGTSLSGTVVPGAPTLGVPQHVIVTHEFGGGGSSWVDGAFGGAHGYTASAFTGSNGVFGALSNGGGGYTPGEAGIILLNTWDRVLSSGEALARMRDPWEIYKRRVMVSLPLQSAPTVRWLRPINVARRQPKLPAQFAPGILNGFPTFALNAAVRADVAHGADSTLTGATFGALDASTLGAIFGNTAGQGWVFSAAPITGTEHTILVVANPRAQGSQRNCAVCQRTGAGPFAQVAFNAVAGSAGAIDISSGAFSYQSYDGVNNDGAYITGVANGSNRAFLVSRRGTSYVFSVDGTTQAPTVNFSSNASAPTAGVEFKIGDLASYSGTGYGMQDGIALVIVLPFAITQEVANRITSNAWRLFAVRGPFAHLYSTVASANDFTALLSEGATLAEAISAVLGISAAATEAATLADTLDGGLAFGAAATESVTLADSESGVYGISSSITESMTLSDAASLIYGLAAEVSEALAADAAQDGSVPTGDFSASLSDAAALADSASSGLGVYAAISAALSLADALSGAMAAGADAGDALTLDEAATRVLGLFSQASEASALDDLSDSVRGVTGGVTEALTATSGQAAVLSSFAGIDESMTLSELEASAKGYAVAIVGALALLEALRARLDRAFAASGARGGRAALDAGSRGARATSARLGRTDSSRRTRH